ncbi:MAG: hypothetical protein ACK4UK_08770, partial [Flavobacterium sp.]
MKAIGQDDSQTKIIDSLQYKKSHVDDLSVLKTSNEIEIQLQKKGYLECRTIDYYKENDSVFIFNYELGKKTQHLYICVTEKTFIHQRYNIVNDTIKIEIEKTEIFLESITQKASQAGYPLTKAQLTDFDVEDGKLIAKLQIET